MQTFPGHEAVTEESIRDKFILRWDTTVFDLESGDLPENWTQASIILKGAQAEIGRVDFTTPLWKPDKILTIAIQRMELSERFLMIEGEAEGRRLRIEAHPAYQLNFGSLYY